MTASFLDDPGATGSPIAMYVLIVLVYLLPCLLAFHWKHRNRGAILITNLLLGWTVLGWIAALIWACTNNTQKAAAGMKAVALFALALPFAAAARAQVIPEMPEPPTHRFVDKKNLTSISLMAAGYASDGYTTERARGLGLRYVPPADPAHFQFDILKPGEGNPLVRPLTVNRLSTAATFGGLFSTNVGLMYWAHRTGHHRIERVLPIVTAGAEASFAFWNRHQITIWDSRGAASPLLLH